MRSIWNGAISFGLVSIPIKLVNATENRSISFRQIHQADGGRIRYRKVCELDGEEVGTAEIGKAYEEADGALIPITDEDLARLPLPTAKTIEIVAFVPAGEIDPLQIDTAYYLSASGVPAAKPYTLLREALKRSERVAICKFALRGRERLGMLRVVDDVIAMHGLLWPDEIRHPEGVAPDTSVTVRDAELDLAEALMDTLGEVDLDSLHDDYREAVEEMIAAKAEGGPAMAPEPQEERGGQVIDLMAALESSVRAAREARGEDASRGAGAEVTDLSARKKPARAPAAPKESGGKKSTARTAAKKTAAPARKSTSKTAASGGGEAGKKAAGKSATKSTARSTAKPDRSAGGTASRSTAKKTASKAAEKKTAASRKRSA
ncbi:non-homologous end joining protein Ku [Streptomyces sp. SP18CS02]|uniref:non-homologous end joining protein Ku n=1 Tax=Streptomyces sp. SP18CS02 TaxID=3002531 RepID=UPI002E7938C4|nr:Ku protein [Streptomyces sp. SP18CS02]MEE1757215.1 Ku protein [Streptomyces sp. SP18CS02]